MSKSIDQVFVNAKQWLLLWLAGSPTWVVQVVSSVINIGMLLVVFLTLFAFMSVLERKKREKHDQQHANVDHTGHHLDHPRRRARQPQKQPLLCINEDLVDRLAHSDEENRSLAR